MQFQVPQFIEVEDKIVGPLTLKQFLIVAAAAGVSFLSFFVFEIWLWIIISIIAGGIAVFFAFIHINGQPSYVVILSGLRFIWSPKLYLWQHKKEDERMIGQEILNPPSQRKNFTLRSLWNRLQSSKENIKNRETRPPGRT